MSGRIAGRDTSDQLRPAIEPSAYLDRLTEPVQASVASLLRIVSDLGGELHWKPTGPTVRVACASGIAQERLAVLDDAVAARIEPPVNVVPGEETSLAR